MTRRAPITRRQAKAGDKLDKLRGLLGSDANLLIVMQDHPDPDAVGSAAALRRIANAVGTTCSLAHGGMIGRSENRALIDYLGLNLRRIHELSIDAFDLVALVDTQPGTGNNGLPGDVRPDIVIDHHPIRRATRAATFTDVRSHYGATSTILWEYLRAAAIEPQPPLATALLYGIRSDTQDLGRGARNADFEAHRQLMPFANLRLLAQIQHATLAPHYFEALHRALGTARVADDCVFACLGQVHDPDMPGAVADILVRRQGIRWCLCAAVAGPTMLLSLRSHDERRDAGHVIRKIVGTRGTAGGHHMIAGGQIPVEHPTGAQLQEQEEWLLERFLKALGKKTATTLALVRDEC